MCWIERPALFMCMTKYVMQKLCFTINPYCESDCWFFDDPAVGLTREGLTYGTPEVLLRACEISGVGSNFTVGFTDTKFGIHRLDFAELRRDGSFYYWADQQMYCWFCPALLRYFSSPPKQIYFFVFSSNGVGSNKPSGRG